MPQPIPHQKKLINRVRRLRGQLDAVERAIEENNDALELMRLLTAIRGATNAIMAKVVEDHLEKHLLPRAKDGKAAEALSEVLQAYLL